MAHCDERITKGGTMIGQGSFGCVFKPSIPCSNKAQSQGSDNVSKIFFGSDSKKEAKEELDIDKKVRMIKGFESWSHVWLKKCNPPSYKDISKHEKDIKKCLESSDIDVSDFNKTKQMLKGTDAGHTFESVMEHLFSKSVFSNKKKFVKNFLHVVKLMKPLFLGIQEMYKNNLSHNDIKEDNVMIDEEGLKFIDFGLAAQWSNRKFYQERSQSEFFWERVYPPYPYEFFYMYADPNDLLDERDELLHKIYRKYNDRYIDLHSKVFQRKKIPEYLVNLIDSFIQAKGKFKDKKKVISLIDTYSLGALFPGLLVKRANKYKKVKNFTKFINEPTVSSYIDLFKHMTEPDYHNRMHPIEANKRYLELEQLYLSKPSAKQECKPTKKSVKKTKRIKNNKRTKRK